MRNVVALEGLTRPDWLRARRDGIGGSDVAAIMGISPYAGPLDVYADKVADDEPVESGDDIMRLGQLMEDGICNAYAEKTGSTITAPEFMVAHDDHGFMLANVDRWTTNEIDGPGILEAKNAHRPWMWDRGVPEHYAVQGYHYLAVTGAPYCDVAVLLGGREVRWWRLEANPAITASLVEIESEFWKLVEDRTPPPPDERSAHALSRLYVAEKDTEVDLPEQYVDLLADLARAKTATAEAKATEALLANAIRAGLGTAEVGKIDDRIVVTWKASERRDFDVDAFRAAHPALAEEFTTKTTVRTLRPKKGTNR
jgi:putative phage-type endonuclease